MRGVGGGVRPHQQSVRQGVALYMRIEWVTIGRKVPLVCRTVHRRNDTIGLGLVSRISAYRARP